MVSNIEQIVFQPTTFCNLDCGYCYLPDRDKKSLMNELVPAKALEFSLWTGLLSSKVDIRWHAGEPLAVPVSFYLKAINSISKVIDKTNVEISHSVQTNGTLLNESWCSLFKEFSFRVGLSIDGPDFIHNANRKRRNGKNTFEQVMKGVELLNKKEIPFEVIAVITSSTIEHPDDFYDFFKNLSPTLLGLNVEELEGVNKVSSLFKSEKLPIYRDISKYRKFIERLLELEEKDGYKLRVREFEHIRRVVFNERSTSKNTQNQPLAILSFDVEGNASTFSPELLGNTYIGYPSFSLGNILYDNWLGMLQSSFLKKLITEVSTGINRCKSECEYFNFCGGGAPANKLFENGSFESTETSACVHKVKVIADLVLSSLERGI